MAETPAPEPRGKMGFLSRKVGPIPVWGWGLIGFGAYYWYTHYGPGKPATTTTSATPAQRPEIVILEPKQTGGGGGKKRRRGGRQPQPVPPRRRPGTSKIPVPRKPAVPAGGPQPQPATAQPGQVVTPQGPVYDQWTADAGGVPDPQEAYAPMTAGSIYG